MTALGDVTVDQVRCEPLDCVVELVPHHVSSQAAHSVVRPVGELNTVLELVVLNHVQTILEGGSVE